MEIFSPSPQNASRLIGKALAPRPNPHRDEEYRDLLQLYTDDFDFQDLVKQIANGLNLNIIYGSQYGLVLGAKSAESQCAVRLTEVNQYFSEVDKAVILICMAVTTMAFFPTAQNLEDPDYNASPLTIHDVLYVLNNYIERFALQEKEDPEATSELLKPGWRILSEMNEDNDNQTQSKSTRSGLLRIVRTFLSRYGFVEVENGDDDPVMLATHKFKYHARELLFNEVFEWLISNPAKEA